jgi:hypothetical protein
MQFSASHRIEEAQFLPSASRGDIAICDSPAWGQFSKGAEPSRFVLFRVIFDLSLPTRMPPTG